MNIMNMLFNKKLNKCEHKNIKWINCTCMILGYKKEGICLDCGMHFLKDTEGNVTEK